MRDLALLFLRLGFTAFGGPAAHIAILHDEVVVRRKWLTEQEFLDMLGATNLIPGPNSTEMMLHVGQRRAGWGGLLVAGACFVTPAMLMVLALAWLYQRFGNLPQAAWLLYGVKPVVIVLIVQALWGLGRKAVKGPWFLLLAAGVVALYFLGVGELVLLFGGAALALLVYAVRHDRLGGLKAVFLPLGLGSLPAAASAFSLSTLFL
ncbi:MAG TPA: chromate transporter, partial [Pseudodesulfovibrio sp.]|nr:chromate transporter [Pseudodesulfovibrio sp.]